MANEFLVSVANVVLRDPNTGNALAYGKANINSSFTMSMQKTEVRGGINNPLLYVYYHDKAIELKIEEATFNKTILGINAGSLAVNGAVNVTETECIMSSASGSATISHTAVGNVPSFSLMERFKPILLVLRLLVVCQMLLNVLTLYM
jgi:hypothetical protein